MDRSKSAHTLRLCVVPVDDTLVALEYVGGEIYGHTVVVDAAQRVVRSSARSRIAWPSLHEPLPDDTVLVHASQVEEQQLTIPVTLLVFRSGVGQRDSVASPRPMKRARRDPAAPQANEETEARTRLSFYALSTGSEGSSGDWRLQFLGHVAVTGDPSTLRIHVVHGPSVVACSTQTNAVWLLQPRVHDEGEYAFVVTRGGLLLPNVTRAELLSCQLMGEELTSTPHLLLQYAESEVASQDDEGVQLGWQPAGERRRLWATIPLLDHDAARIVVSPCTYLSSYSAAAADLGMTEQITSCTFIPPPSPCQSVGQPANSARPSDVLDAPRLHASVVILAGTSNSTLHVISNDLNLATYVVAGTPLRIQVTSAHGDSGSTLVAVILCADADRSFHMLSIDVWGDRQRVVAPLQHFTFVGSMVQLPFIDEHPREFQLMLINHVESVARQDDLIALALRKSVVVTYYHAQAGHATSSCHRLKYRAHEKKSKELKGRREAQDEDKYQTIERVKIDKREREFELHSPNASKHSGASEQQLSMLIKSLEDRLRIGTAQTDRLQRVCDDKVLMTRRLNELLVTTYKYGAGEDVSSSCEGVPVELVRVVCPAESLGDQDGGQSTLEQTQCKVATQPVSRLHQVSIVSFDPSRSLLHLTLDVQADLHTTADSDKASAQFWVFVLDCANADVAMRSRSRVAKMGPLSLDADSQHRVNLDLLVEVPRMYRQLRRHSFTLDLWLKMESATDRFISHAATHRIGEVEVDLVSLMENATDGRTRFCTPIEDLCSARRDGYLIVSGGSSVREIVSRTQARSQSLQWQLIRPLFGVLSVGLPGDPEFDALARLCPWDVISLVNPLTQSSLATIQGLIRLLQSEVDEVSAFESQQYDDKEDASEVIQQRLLSFMTRQLRTDLQALQFLNDLQRRVNFHVLSASPSQ